MIFDVINNEPVIVPASLTIPELHAIWDKYDDKNEAQKMLSYVYHMVDPKSPYSNIEYYKKEDYILKDLKIDKKEIDNSINLAKEKYRELISTPSLRFLEACETALDKIALHLLDTDIESGGGGNIKDIMAAIDKGGDSMSKLSKLKEAYLRELNTDRKIRGGVSPSSLMEGK